MRAPTPIEKVRADWHQNYIPEPNSGCYLWLRYLSNYGYGQMRIGGRKEKLILAHRLAYQFFVADIPDKLIVRHACDNPSCVNPDHLLLGTQQDNSDDMVRRKRYGGPRNLPKGADHPRSNAKLSDDDVRAIRKSNEPQQMLAAKYGVDQAAISRAKTGKSYAHVMSGPPW